MFEIDYERIDESDTWSLASPELRPWLLMLWLSAWRQTPCGTLPDDDALIAARIAMPMPMFQMHRAVLMRGWNRHSDGRLYHRVLVEKVLTMLAVRAGESKRKAAYRAKKHQAVSSNVPWDTTGTDAESHGRALPEPNTGTIEPIPSSPTKNVGEEGADDAARHPPAIAAKRVRKKHAAPNCPYESIVALYHELLPNNPRIAVLNDRRRSRLRKCWLLWAEHEKHPYGDPATQEGGLAFWRKFFEGVSAVPHYMGKGKAKPGYDEPFVADFDFLIGEKHVRVVEYV